MINPSKLYEIAMEAKAGITAINKLTVVVTDDEFTETLSDHKSADNILLVAVLPEFNGFGEEDESGMMTYLQFVVLEKVDYKAQRGDDYLQVFNRTLDASWKFLVALFANAGICGGEIFQHDWTIRPVARKSQCNGYEIQINSKSFTEIF